jgi:hypothetical protein
MIRPRRHLPPTRTHTAAWREAARRSFQAMPGPARRASGTGLVTRPSMGTCVRKVECWLGPTLTRRCRASTAPRPVRRYPSSPLVSLLSITGTTVPPRWELLAPRSFAVAGAGQRLVAVRLSRSRSVALLHFRAVRLLARPVQLPVLSVRFSGGLASPGVSTTGRVTRPYGVPTPLKVHDHPHVSTAVVSKLLARSRTTRPYPNQVFPVLSVREF